MFPLLIVGGDDVYTDVERANKSLQIFYDRVTMLAVCDSLDVLHYTLLYKIVRNMLTKKRMSCFNKLSHKVYIIKNVTCSITTID